MRRLRAPLRVGMRPLWGGRRPSQAHVHGWVLHMCIDREHRASSMGGIRRLMHALHRVAGPRSGIPRGSAPAPCTHIPHACALASEAPSGEAEGAE